MSVGTEGSSPNPRTYSRAEYAALEVENARLTAQLAAIQGRMGDVVELAKDEQSKSEYWAAAESKAFSVEVPTEVWRAGYAAGCQRITAAMAAEVERLKHSQQVLMQSRNAHRDERDALRAELTEVKGREAVPVLVAYECCHCGAPTEEPKPFSAFVVCPACGEKTAATRAARYAPASPDVEGLLRKLCDPEKGGIDDYWRENEGAELMAEIEAALSTWRQAQESKP